MTTTADQYTEPALTVTAPGPRLMDFHVVDVDEIRAAAWHETRHIPLSDLQVRAVGDLYLRAIVTAVHMIDGVGFWLPMAKVLGVVAAASGMDVALAVTLTVNAACYAPDPDVIAAVLAAVLGGDRTELTNG